MTWQDLSRHRLQVYSTTWCPDCHRLKRVFKARGVAFTEIDIDADAAAAERLQKATGRSAIPFVQIDDAGLIRGWHEGEPGGFSETLFLEEVAGLLGGVGKA